MTYRVVCAFGDSITNGYWDEEGKGGWFGRLAPLLLAAKPYQFGFNNLAMDGDRSYDILHRLQSEGLARDCGIILIACGINDLIRWHQPDAPVDLSLALREEIWDKILVTAKRLTPRVMVLPVLPVDETQFPQEGVAGRLLYHRNSDVVAYNQMIQDMCQRHGVAFADFLSQFPKEKWPSMLYDASHPNAAGHQMLAELVFAAFSQQGWV